MAITGATPAVAAAFTFGLLTNAASAALFLYCRGHGSAIFRDGQRLVLIIFLACSALWAQIDFISVLLDISDSSMPCQVATIFSTIFDQLARFSIEQYLLWAMNTGAKVSAGQLVPQLLILGRFVAGGVFAGFTRAQTDTFCVATSSVVPVAITVIVLDVVILLLLAFRAFRTGLVANMKGPDAPRSKSLMFVMLGFAIWTATSVTMLLGMTSINLAARTAAPAAGLTVLIIIVTACVESLSEARRSGSRPPEAPSPRRLNISRDISTSDSDYPPSRYEDLKEATIRSSTTFINPREVPILKDETDVGLPTIARPITGISGVGGLPVQGELFPPPRAATVAAVAGSGVARKVETSGSQKKRMFGRSASSAGNTGGKLVIGNPILQDNDGQNPLNKIQVVDLAEAVKAERDRRAKVQRDSGLVANRPAPQPPAMTIEEGLKRAVSVKRKEVQSTISQPGNFPPSLQPGSAGMTTSAQLSPATDEVRRRSPRHVEIPFVLDDSQQLSATTGGPRTESLLPQQAAHALSTSPVQEPQAVAEAVPTQPMPNMGIRPSRRLPSPKSPPPPEPTKTPLQRRPTIGLPSNPKSRGMKIEQQAKDASQQTVLFVNNIVYNNPETVEGIIRGANDRVKAAPAPVAAPAPAPGPDSPGTRRSVVNRPRPIPRKVADPQPSPSPSHRRSKSGGSFSRKSILTSMPGSPTQLPPLPDLPRSAGAAIRPQPNDTKSMSFDEKMTIFFPSPPSGKAAKRRSSVPELPRIPISYLDASSNSPTETEDHRMSKRTTFRTESVFDVDEITDVAGQGHRRAPSVADEVGNSWLPGIATEIEDDKQMRTSQRSQESAEAGRRASSPVIPAVPIRSSAWTESSDGRTQDDATTNWGSVHSPELAVGVPVGRKVAQPMTIQKQDRPGFGAAKRVMPRPGDASRQTMMNKPKASSHENEISKPERASQWHHRVGDECPTFSARKEKTRSRKVPPPTPLMLNGSTVKKPVYVQTEPSPVESPEHILHQIQEQLKNFDEPTSQVQDSSDSETDRLALLEKEMGMQEDHWQEMKHDLGRDSLSSVQTASPSIKNAHAETVAANVQVAQETTVKSSMAERRASRRAQMRLSTASRRTSTQSNDNAQLNNWQKRLTEAQMEYMDTAAKMLRDRNSGYLTMPMSVAQLGSPTPPDSDQSDEEVTHPARQISRVLNPPVTKPAKAASLWTRPTPEKRSGPTKLLWHPVAKPTPEPEVDLPSLSLRLAPRAVKDLAPLQIHSTQLWRKPHAGIQRSDGGLWRPVWASAAPPVDPSLLSQASSDSQSQKPPRPLTQRPPRRNKRVTLLPDILESPQPLPDKRGTLGIFQFPWGEKSDTASVQPTFQPTRLMAMPGTMASGGPSIAIESRSRQVEAAEYSSSFFDDYDDDEENDQNSDDEDGTDSDDGFDETTLWEIASLLKTDNVPSKNSMFPPASSSVISDYMDSLAQEDESREQSIMIGLAEESREHFFNQSPPVAVESTTLWTVEDEQDHIQDARPLQPRTRKVKSPTSLGLWQHPEIADDDSFYGGMFALDSGRSDYRTTSAEPAAKKMERKPRATTLKPLEKLASTSLWAAENVPRKIQHHWTGPKARITEVVKSKAIQKIPRPTATEADWMAALNEAILASYPTSKAARDIVFASASHVRRSRPLYIAPHFDVATRHPVFAASSLVTKSEWFHPAATGYTYDPAIVNPVFFGSLAITCPLESVHPAMASYAAKKLRHQRSRRDGTQSVSRSNSSSSWRDRDRAALTRSDSNRMKRKEEIRAQLRALEEQTTTAEPTSAPQQPAPANDMFMPEADPMIQAQIEALEQERLFVERAAQEEYRRRTSLGSAGLRGLVGAGAESGERYADEQAIPAVPSLTRVDSVEDLQRHLQAQVRQSLVLSSTGMTMTGRPGTAASSSASSSSSSSFSTSHAHSHSDSQSSMATSSMSPVSSVSSGSNSPSRGHGHDHQSHTTHNKPVPSLWSPPSPPSPKTTSPSPTTHHLWSPYNTTSTNPPTSTLKFNPLPGIEDSLALARREKGRKQIQKQRRRNEIFAQIAAIEAGIDIRAKYNAQGVWSLMGVTERRMEEERKKGRDWLREGVEVVSGHRRGASRVMLRY